MAGLVPAIHVLLCIRLQRRGCPGQARAWRTRELFCRRRQGV